jgi:hypothetical protein
MTAYSFIGLSGIGLASAPDGFLYLLGGVICFRDYLRCLGTFWKNMNFVHSLSLYARNRTHAHTRTHTGNVVTSEDTTKTAVGTDDSTVRPYQLPASLI